MTQDIRGRWRLFDDDIPKHNVPPGQLTLHADRGGPMQAKATALLLADFGVTRSHNRPHTSNDNPCSESHFKTLKYQPRFPQRFGCIEDAKSFCRRFFDWCNRDHHHAGIGLMTPDQVHYGQTDAVHAAGCIKVVDTLRSETSTPRSDCPMIEGSLALHLGNLFPENIQRHHREQSTTVSIRQSTVQLV